MSQTLKAQKAQYEFRTFIRRLFASQARHSGLYDEDVIAGPSVTVAKEDVLRSFLATWPELVEFRRELMQVHPGHSRFAFARDRWSALTGLENPKKAK